MNPQLPESIEADVEDLAHGTRLTEREAAVLYCDRVGIESESIRAVLGKTSSDGELLLSEIGRIIGASNSTVEQIRTDIRAKKRELEDEKKEIERTLAVIEGDG